MNAKSTAAELSAGHVAGNRPLVTVQSHILEQQMRNPDSAGDLSWILSAISISAKMIAAQVRRARLEDVLGSVGAQNVQGETQQKLDVIANDILMRNLGGRQGVAVVASEENEQPIILRDDNDGETRYCVMFDPLDGSSSLDIAGGVGTIFSILRKDRRSGKIEDSLLQPGTRQVAAGYVLYGSSTVLVMTMGHGVDMFVLDPSIGAFVRVLENLKIPPKQKCYSMNEGNRLTLPEGYQRYLHWAQEQGYSSRYIGAMVADVHRIMIQGGVFLYPPTKKAPKGKLRLMYEANPMAMLIEQAGGKALAGPAQRILDLQPTEIHQRCCVVLGSSDEVDQVFAHLT
jgi:fructose-1,6-bisphosphatase I